MEKIYDKLIRDRIPEILSNEGKECDYRMICEEEYFKALNDKLLEEVNEYEESLTVEELCDIAEVMDAIRNYIGVTKKEFETLKREKRSKRGGFREGFFLHSVIEDEDNEYKREENTNLFPGEEEAPNLFESFDKAADLKATKITDKHPIFEYCEDEDGNCCCEGMNDKPINNVIEDEKAQVKEKHIFYRKAECSDEDEDEEDYGEGYRYVFSDDDDDDDFDPRDYLDDDEECPHEYQEDDEEYHHEYEEDDEEYPHEYEEDEDEEYHPDYEEEEEEYRPDYEEGNERIEEDDEPNEEYEEPRRRGPKVYEDEDDKYYNEF